MKLPIRVIATVTALAALTLSGCSQGKGGNESSASASASTSAAATDAPAVNRNYKGALPAVKGEFAKSATIAAGSGDAPKEIVAKTLKAGDGEEVKADDVVMIHYAGALWNGTEFDSSFKRSTGDNPTPALFSLNNLIKGWKYGLAGQHVGDRVELVIPPEWGYGDKEQGSIPANSHLVFVVDIVNRVDPTDLSALKGAEDQKATLPTGITISGKLGEEPKLTVAEDAKLPDKLTTVVIAEGKGEMVDKTDHVVVHMVTTAVPSKGQAQSTWQQGQPIPTQQPIGDTLEIAGHHVGTRLLLLAPGEGNNPAAASVVDIVAKISSAPTK